MTCALLCLCLGPLWRVCASWEAAVAWSCVCVYALCVCVSCTKPSSVLCRQTDTRDGRSDAVAAVRNQQVRRAEPCTPHLTPPAHANTVSCLAPMWSTSGACWVASVTAAQPNVAHHCGGAAHPGQHTRGARWKLPHSTHTHRAEARPTYAQCPSTPAAHARGTFTHC